MKTSQTFLRVLLGSLALLALSPGTALADRHWHEGEMHRFHDRDMGRWEAGNWHHGRHLGRLGWWWVAGGVWYLYPEPVYPYPDPYTPPVVLAPAPAPVVSPPPPAPVPAQAQYWYYCDKSKTYYPYVATCPGGWRRVPASPAP